MSWAIGDPSGMRALAGELRAESERLRNTAAALAKSQPTVHQFQGPYPSRVVAAIRSNRLRAIRLADRLLNLSTYLNNAADTVAHEQYRLEVERIRRQQEADEQRRRQQQQQRRS